MSESIHELVRFPNLESKFVGKDVAEILGYERATKAIRDHVDEEDVDEIPIQDSIGRMQNTPIINESGLYGLVLSSKLASAKRFSAWFDINSQDFVENEDYTSVLTSTEVQKRYLIQIGERKNTFTGK